MQHFRLNKRLVLSAAVTASLFLAGCVSIGPRGLELSRTEFNSAIQRTDGEQLLLHYQPVVDLATGRITAVEALVR